MAQRASDQVTLADLTDGVSVVLTSEAVAFPGSTSAALAGSTTTKVLAFLGTEQVAASVVLAEITKPAGITIATDSHATEPTLTISIATSVTAGGEVVIPVHVGDLIIVKRFSFSIAFKGSTGTAGTSATLTGLKNEAHTIVAKADGTTPAGSTIQVDFYGYVGNSRAAVTAAVGTLPAGITVGTNTPGTTSADGVLTLNVASGAGMGGADSGVIPITLTCNSIARVVNFSWAKAKAGVDGTDGTDGAAAISLEVTSSAGLVFKNTQVATTLTARVYVGGTEVTGGALTALGTLKWYKDGTYLTGKDGVTLTVAAGDVADRATYEARLEN